jgi:hypothetical protein
LITALSLARSSECQRESIPIRKGIPDYSQKGGKNNENECKQLKCSHINVEIKKYNYTSWCDLLCLAVNKNNNNNFKSKMKRKNAEQYHHGEAAWKK